MPDSPDWYEVTRGSELLQGDLLHNCPIPRVRGLEHWPLRAGQPLEVDIDQEDVVIVSQSCDLANDKIQDVVLAQVLDWAVACRALIRQGNTFVRSQNFRRAGTHLRRDTVIPQWFQASKAAAASEGHAMHF